MQLYTILLVFSILTSRLHPGCSVSKPTLKIFQKVPYLKDRTVTQEALAKETVKSDVDCGRRCDRVGKCVMFTFLSAHSDNHPGECRMYGQLTESLTVHSPGASSYRLKDSPKKSDNGYSMMGGLYLRFVSTPMVFSTAKNLCQELDNGHLAIPRTLDDLTLFHSISVLTDTRGLWLGADDLAEEGKYVWHNGSTLSVDSPLWANGNPVGRTNLNCIGTRSGSTPLRDIKCHQRRYVLCQKDLVG